MVKLDPQRPLCFDPSLMTWRTLAKRQLRLWDKLISGAIAWLLLRCMYASDCSMRHHIDKLTSYKVVWGSLTGFEPLAMQTWLFKFGVWSSVDSSTCI